MSNSILGDIDNIDNVKIYQLTDIENNPFEALNAIHKSIEFKSEIDKKSFLDGIKRLNNIISIKPSFFNSSIKLVAIIDKWLDKKRKEQLFPKGKGGI